jgi:hypothetical protein
LTLREQYLGLGKRNHRHGTPEAERRLSEARVLEFLIFCEVQGVRRLEDIRQEHYAAFIRDLGSRGLSAWTIYKYQLAIRGMSMRRRLRLKIDASLPRQKENRRKRILGAMRAIPDLTPDQIRWILKALNEVL